MSQLFHLDSGDHYDNASAYIKWFSSPIMQTNGRTGKGWRSGSKAFAVGNKVTVGFAHKRTVGPDFTADPIIRLINVAATTNLDLFVAQDSRFRLVFSYIGNRAYSAWSPVTTFRDQWWSYIELKTEYSVFGGQSSSTHFVTFSLRLNEELILSGQLYIERNVADSDFTSMQFGGAFSVSQFYDDLYVTDDEFLGDVRVYVIRPNAEGDINEWTSFTGGPNYLEVDDINPDFDSSYISTNVRQTISMVNMEDIILTGIIKGIQFNIVCMKDDAGTASFRSYNKIGGSHIEELTDIYPAFANWLDKTIAYRKVPNSTNDFTISQVNSLQAGVKRIL